ncbi:MAG: SMC-Scp complex subunit ScpB [Candidatus Margulisiibacteriota bacterium]
MSNIFLPVATIEETEILIEVPEQHLETDHKKMLLKELEAMLFMAKQPITLDSFEKFLEIDQKTILNLIDELIVEYQDKGINIFNIAGGYTMGTSAECALKVHKLLENPTRVTLSKAAFEVLAIVAYRQPITRSAIEHIRGVNSDAVISSLQDKNLLREAGRSEDIGRPMLIGTTDDFLKHFGLRSLEALPAHPFAATQLPLELERGL